MERYALTKARPEPASRGTGSWDILSCVYLSLHTVGGLLILRAKVVAHLPSLWRMVGRPKLLQPQS